MKHLSYVVLIALGLSGQANAQDRCPKTVGTDSLGDPFPESDRWHGNEVLAVQLPRGGMLHTTLPDQFIAAKFFWWSSGFRTETDLKVTIRNLYGGPNSANASQPTKVRELMMLTGLDFPDPGCWEIRGEYRDQVLTFVIETFPVDEWRRRLALLDER